jgi:UDP-2-acetamido-2,6-beta-L-arabino-hexul-4-ose reductase
MNRILITGSKGFIGKNLIEALSRQEENIIYEYDIGMSDAVLESALKEANIIFHLAGVNRPVLEADFDRGNAGSMEKVLSMLKAVKRTPAIVMTSSIQGELNNPYGRSKKRAEDLLIAYREETEVPVYIYRLTNVFGKWCKPNYNSVVATFCHNIANGLDIKISDRNKEIELVYIDDVINHFIHVLNNYPTMTPRQYESVTPIYKTSLGELADRIYALHDMRKSLVIPDMSDNLNRYLYAVYLSYLNKGDFSYDLQKRTDDRGRLVELIKSEHFGQIFVSKTYGAVIRGNHYHNTKTEKFCVIQGEAVIRFRHILSEDITSYHVSGDDMKIVDIPPGYTHSIENLSDQEMIVLFWADEIFDPKRPDTYHCEV